MSQAVLLSNIATEIIGNAVRLFSPGSIKLQFTPYRDGFSAYVRIEAAMAQSVSPGHLWYSIPTIGLNPWFSAAELEFNGHAEVVAFDLRLDPGILWIRASIIEYSRGTVSVYIAH